MAAARSWLSVRAPLTGTGEARNWASVRPPPPPPPLVTVTGSGLSVPISWAEPSGLVNAMALAVAKLAGNTICWFGTTHSIDRIWTSRGYCYFGTCRKIIFANMVFKSLLALSTRAIALAFRFRQSPRTR